jgi:hypothetical protein
VAPAEKVEIVWLHFDDGGSAAHLQESWRGGSAAQPQEHWRPFATAEHVVDERVATQVPDCGQRLRLRDT